MNPLKSFSDPSAASLTVSSSVVPCFLVASKTTAAGSPNLSWVPGSVSCTPAGTLTVDVGDGEVNEESTDGCGEGALPASSAPDEHEPSTSREARSATVRRARGASDTPSLCTDHDRVPARCPRGQRDARGSGRRRRQRDAGT